MVYIYTVQNVVYGTSLITALSILVTQNLNLWITFNLQGQPQAY